MTFFHYTSAERLPVIIESGMILPSESNVDPYHEHVGPDVVWLLDRQIGTSHLTHGLDGSMYDKRSAFIEVDVPAIWWLSWEWTWKMKPEWRDVMITSGGGPTAAAQWYVWPASISRRRWIRTEVIT